MHSALSGQQLRNTPPAAYQWWSRAQILDTTDDHRGPPRSTDNVKGIRTLDIMALNNIHYFDLEAMRGQKFYLFERMKLVLQSMK